MIIRILQEKLGNEYNFEYQLFGKTFVYTTVLCQINKIMQNIGIDIISYLSNDLNLPAKTILSLTDSIEFKIYNYLGTKESPNIYKLKEIF